MEILELVHQETAPSVDRPFGCSFNDCKKTFGKLKEPQHCSFIDINVFIPFSLGRRSDLVRHSRIHTNER